MQDGRKQNQQPEDHAHGVERIKPFCTGRRADPTGGTPSDKVHQLVDDLLVDPIAGPGDRQSRPDQQDPVDLVDEKLPRESW